MLESEIADVLQRRLGEAALPYSIVWENLDGLPDRPYLTFEIVRVSRRDQTLDNTGVVSTGYVQVTAVSATDAFATDGIAIGEEVATLFPRGLRLPVSGGEVVITDPPNVEQGFRDGPDWRTPVRINYRAD
ncbi:phage tail terminator-like protein [Halovulum sp. GXIMD14793]